MSSLVQIGKNTASNFSTEQIDKSKIAQGLFERISVREKLKIDKTKRPHFCDPTPKS